MRNRQQAFTLLEILIALMIFAIISVMMTLVLQSVFTTRQRITEQSQRLAKLQIAVVLMQHDLQQTINRPVRNSEGILQPALLGNASDVQFTRGGFSNPQALEQRSELQRVAYFIKDHQLFRRSWNRLDPVNANQYADKLLLDNVNSLQFSYLDTKNNNVKFWPLTRKVLVNAATGAPIDELPHAVQLTMRLEKMGKIDLLFPIASGEN